MLSLFDLIAFSPRLFKKILPACLLLALILPAPASELAPGAKSLFYRQLCDSRQVSNMGLTYSIELIRQGKTALVDSRFPFVSGDQLRFHVQSNIDGFIYIILKHGSRGDSALLYPVAAENNHICAGKDLLVPEKGVLEFDNVAGSESVKLVLSAEKLQGDPAAYSRSIMISPKHDVDTMAAQYLIDFALKNSSEAVFRNADNPPQFASEPAVTVVSTDARKILSVIMELHHGAGGGSSSGLTVASAAPGGTAASGITTVSGSIKVSNSAVLDLVSSARELPGIQGGQPAGEILKPSAVVKDKWAVIIGISEFKNPAWNLLYPAKDAQDLAKFLVSEGHFAPDHVKVLTNASATRENILTTLGSNWLPRNAGPGDIVFVYFASHGTSAEQDIARKSFLVAYDTDPQNAFATGIELQDLSRTIKRRIASDRIIIVIDACHAGAAEPGAKALFPPQSFSLADLLPGSGQLVIASANENQIAHDSRRYKNGIFTKHFIDGLRQNKRLADAFAYARTKVEEESKQDFREIQSPVLKDNEWKGSGVILLVPPAEPGKTHI